MGYIPPCPRRANHCWHTTGATMPNRGRLAPTMDILEVPVSDVKIHQVCCYCNVVQTVSADSLRGTHGPYLPDQPLNVTEAMNG